MKKRLRKKKRVGEFQELGFGVGLRLSSELSDEASDAFFRRFLKECIEDHSLVFGGGGDMLDWSGYVCAGKIKSTGTATDAHRETVKQWFIAQSEIAEYYITPLIDAWYSGCDNDDEDAEWIKK